MKIGPAVRPGRRIEKKKVRTEQDSTAPTVPIETKICKPGNLADVITCAKFQDEIFRGYDFTGDRICGSSDVIPPSCWGLERGVTILGGNMPPKLLKNGRE